MSNNELATQQQPQHLPSPFQRGGAVGALAAINAGAVSIEQERAIAEAQGQLILAKRFPRDLNAGYAELMEACKLPALASVAFYSVPRGNQKVTGPSIRLAEEIARIYGNFEYGHRELSRDDKKSEVEVYAWDKEKNNRSVRQITVEHVLDTRDGPRKLRDQKDIDDKIANVASKQVRGRILALLPKWMVEAAVQECRKTIAGENDEPISVRVRKMTQAFAKFGVNAAALERYLDKKLDDVNGDDIADLQGVYNSIKEGGSINEFFGGDDSTKEEADASAAQATVAKARTSGKNAKAQQQTAAASDAATEQHQEQQQSKAEPAAEPAKKTTAKEVNAVKEESKPVKEDSAAAVVDDANNNSSTAETGGEEDDVF